MCEPAGFIEAALRNDGAAMEIVWGFEAGGVAPGLNTRRLSPWSGLRKPSFGKWRERESMVPRQ